MEVMLREYTEADAAAVLRLNAESVAVLSSMDGARFRALAAMADMLQVAEVAGQVVGFLMAFTDGRAYDSVNYRWFAARLKRFLYIDRVVLDPSYRGAGLGTRFYQRAEQYARAAGLAWLVAEVDVVPPNRVSLAFHDRRGFVEVDRQAAGGGKMVSLRVRSLGAEPSAAADGPRA
ncbi:MAG: GNAT family N-acetyltransferase [Rhodanobacteraceae bacterium]|nr:MAG: GNAT family N-acetyltransferase [Rhodanobacteraceae bacterium]